MHIKIYSIIFGVFFLSISPSSQLFAQDENKACISCHSRHSFSVAQARQPKACGKCHVSPDHPKMEISNESKRIIKFNAVRSTSVMKLDKGEWIVDSIARKMS